MPNSTISGGRTRSGKTQGEIFRTLNLNLDGVGSIYLDPQPHSGAVTYGEACETLGIPIVREDADSLWHLNCDFGTATGDSRKDALAVDNIIQSLFSDRGQGNASSYVQTAEQATMAVLVKMYTGLAWHELTGMWFSNTNRKIIAMCTHPDALEWLLSRPTQRSSQAREMYPAMRLLQPLIYGPSLRMCDAGKSDVIEILNRGWNIAISGGQLITRKEMSFLCTFRIMEVIQAAQEGRLTRPVHVVIDESELLGLNLKIANAVQAMEKYGISFSIICQVPDWDTPDKKITKILMQNSNHLWYASNSESVLDIIADDLAGLFDPYYIKRIRQSLRQIVNGFKSVDTESITKRTKGESITSGQRDRNAYYRWIESTEDFMSIHEQRQLLKIVVSELGPGQCLSKCDGEIDYFSIPELSTWITEKREERLRAGFGQTPAHQHNYLKKGSLIQPKSLPIISESSLPPNEFDASDL